MSINDIQFLKDLQKQMQHENEHDYDGQASPRYWVVGDYKWETCWSENAEKFEIYIPDDADTYDWEELKNQELEHNNHDLDDEAIEELKLIEDEDSLLSWVEEHINYDAYLVPLMKMHIIRPDTMFLTKEEAKQHIKLNHYHYTKEAHTYAMTAWRAPKVERLLKILSEFDFENLNC